MASRVIVVILVVLVLLTSVTAYLAYSAFTTVQGYAARLSSAERELTTIKGQADKVRADSDAVSGRLKRLEDEVARIRR